MVNIGVLYAITAGVAAITIYVIIRRIILTEHKDLIDKKLVSLLSFCCCFCMVDTIWGLLTSKLFIVSRPLYTVVTYGFHLGAALSAFFWAGYVIHYLEVNKKYRLLLNFFRAVVLIVQLSVLISNIWTNIFFYVDADANYHSLYLRNFMFFMQFLYYITMILYALIALITQKHRGNQEKLKSFKSALSFSCVPLAFGIGQMLWPDAAMYSLGFMLTVVLIYSINISSEREVFLEKIYQSEANKLKDIVLGLSSDYQAIYFVNLENDDYEDYGVSGEYKERIATQFENNRNFFEDFIINGDRVICPEDRAEVYHMLSKEYIIEQLSKKKSYSFNYRLQFGDIEKYYLCKVIRVADDNEKNTRVIIGIFDDDGRIKKETEQKNALMDALKLAENSSNAKTVFLFNMSHDIRTPMNSIIGFTNLAKKHIDDKDYLLECLEKISISGNHLLSLINDVLDMSRIESGKLQITPMPKSILDINNQITSIVQEMAIKKSIAFNTRLINVEQEWINCDALHLNQVLLNILSNAINYTNPGGKIEYSVEQKEINNDKVELVLKVKDSGIGMSEEFLEKIFDEFERENNSTDSGVQGTGLGMSIVKRLVNMMNGTIEIQSKRGVGTEVTITLEFDKAEAQNVEEDSVDENNSITLNGRVLLVDDNILNREIAVDILEDLGIECEEACDGREAIECIKNKEEGYFDLILMDIQMPGLNGYEATKIIRAMTNSNLASIPIIAMTANAFEEDKLDAYNAGMNAHISKPINIPILIKTLKKYLKEA